ncbi:MAG: GNAT family protein, partial [Ignavibacteriaceae bacterium]
MKDYFLSVREIKIEDIEPLTQYWLNSEPDFLINMGVDLDKVPSEEELTKMLKEQINSSIEKKLSYALIWLAENKPVGHTNVNKIEFGKEAYMHLHLWNSEHRKKGMGTEFVKLSLPYFFENLKLIQLFCEPYSLNPAPNKTLEKIGFEFEKEYVTIPGSINFEQKV